MEKVFISFDKEPGYAMKESLRSLRTNIQFCGDDVRTIMFTSCVPDEGKSTVVLDLARSISESGKNVLLIDTDMRKSVLLRRLHAKGENNKEIYGLSHFLSGQKTIEEVFYSTTITKSSVKDAVLCRAEETARWGIRPVDCIKEWERD